MEFQPLTVLSNRQLSPGNWLLTLLADQPLPEIKAGQFLNLRCDPHDQHSLLRPFSILDADPYANTISVYYKHLGRLSSQLSAVRPGVKLDCLYPLGGGFPWNTDWRRVALVGGGVGLAPLLCLASQLMPYSTHMEVLGFFGGRTAADLVPELLEDYQLGQVLATDDGSLGLKGTVVDAFVGYEGNFDVIYTCGPNAMMRALYEVLPIGVPAFASLEEYMACGVGACYGCAARIITEQGIAHKTVCKDGPVFDLRQVVFA
jgi:dihydroorotate dehydrogenase electron transfer subunit